MSAHAPRPVSSGGGQRLGGSSITAGALQSFAVRCGEMRCVEVQYVALCRKGNDRVLSLQHTATHCNTLDHTKRVAVCCSNGGAPVLRHHYCRLTNGVLTRTDEYNKNESCHITKNNMCVYVYIHTYMIYPYVYIYIYMYVHKYT